VDGTFAREAEELLEGIEGGRVGGEMSKEVAVSKALSKLLRHAAEDAGLILDEGGFARVDQVVSLSRLHASAFGIAARRFFLLSREHTT
jgi:RNA:NAD 2'-phosphotransferase (TPT1/KptA family)